MKKQILFLTAALFLASTSLFSQRQQIGSSDSYWELIINGNDTTLKISGTGDMPDFEYNDAPWSPFRSALKHIEIGDSITKIGNNAFYNYFNVISCTIGNSVVTIGESAFF